MVAKGLIRDYVNSFIGEVDKSKVLNEAATKLKEVLPDLDRKTLRNAFLKEGEFKQPTKKSLNEALNQAKRDLLKIEKEQSKKEATEDELQKKKLEQEKPGTQSLVSYSLRGIVDSRNAAKELLSNDKYLDALSSRAAKLKAGDIYGFAIDQETAAAEALLKNLLTRSFVTEINQSN